MSKYISKRINLSDVTLENEIWKDIDKTNSLFKISSLGRIYSNVSRRLLSLKPHKTYGYVCLPLSDGNKRITFRSHRLVAEAFIPNPTNKKEVNHKNKDRSDNRVENLEWATGWENTQHKYGIGIWNNHQGKISTTNHSIARRKLEGFSNKIVPMIQKLVPLN